MPNATAAGGFGYFHRPMRPPKTRTMTIHRTPRVALAAPLICCSIAMAQATTLGSPATTRQAVAPRLIDAAAAQALGLAPGWQSRLPLLETGRLAGMRLGTGSGDSNEGMVLAWDDDGVIMQVDPVGGAVRWQSASPAKKHGETIVDVSAAQTRDASLVVGLGDTSCILLDARTGSELGRSGYPHIPVTSSVRVGSDLVFGSRAGHVVWMGFRDEKVPSRIESRPGDPVRKDLAVTAIHTFAYEEQAHQLKGAIVAPPIAVGDAVVACSTGGQIACFGGDRRTRLWQIELPGAIVAAPASDGERLFVGCRDQYLRCIDARKGRTLWKWFCESPLENPPLATDGLVMLQVPDLGLVAIESGAEGGLSRSPKWKSAAPGNPITRLTDGVIAWDARTSTLSLVDATSGIVRESRTLPGVTEVLATAPLHGDLYLISADGRMQRCPPRNPPKPAPKAEPASSVEEGATPEATAGDETAPAADAPTEPTGA
jgi:hypothetical protein